jgi:hypothetical protein
VPQKEQSAHGKMQRIQRRAQPRRQFVHACGEAGRHWKGTATVPHLYGEVGIWNLDGMGFWAASRPRASHRCLIMTGLLSPIHGHPTIPFTSGLPTLPRWEDMRRTTSRAEHRTVWYGTSLYIFLES